MSITPINIGQAISGQVNFEKPSALKPEELERVRAAAQEFEAAMINAWWQSMQESFTGNDVEKLGGDSAVLQDLSRQTMASAIAQAGGIGFSAMILEQLSAAADAPIQVPAKPADL